MHRGRRDLHGSSLRREQLQDPVGDVLGFREVFPFSAASSLRVKAAASAWLPVRWAQAGNSRWMRWIFAGSRSK